MNESDIRSATGNESKKKTPTEWGRFWFDRLAKFHNVHDPAKWKFSEAGVIAFLQANKKAGMPTWKRLMVVKGLITYRNQFLKSHEPRLEDIRATLQKRVFQEREREVAPNIEEVVDKINPREPDVIQALRRTLRVHGKAYNTEKAYVKRARRFMKVRGVNTLAPFQAMEARDVEAFLTELAVDGGVAAKTQEQAFYALLFLFQLVLKKDIRGVNALRSDKPKLVPTVLSKPEVIRVLKEMTGVYRLMAELLYGCGSTCGERWLPLGNLLAGLPPHPPFGHLLPRGPAGEKDDLFLSLS